MAEQVSARGRFFAYRSVGDGVSWGVVCRDAPEEAGCFIAPSRGLSEAKATTIANALNALDGLLTYDRVVRPAFRSKPMGAPGSQARIDTDKLIELEDAALRVMRAATGAA